MSSKQFFLVVLFFGCIGLLGIQVYAKNLVVDMANPACLSASKDLDVTSLKVVGAVQKNSLIALLNKYPNIEQLDLLNSKFIAYTDHKMVTYALNEVPSAVFNKREKLKIVVLPRSVTKIGKGAFWKCSSLQKVILPDSLKVIDQFAFQLCVSLTKITFPKGLESIGGASFASCQSLHTVHCLRKTPPAMPDWTPFPEFKPAAFVIYVPKESIADYQNDKFLKNFEIKGLTKETRN